MLDRRLAPALLLMLGLLPSIGHAEELVYPAASGVYRAELAKEFYRSEDMMLQGVHATSTVSFTRPQQWELTEDPTVHVEFEHSGALLPERSHLTVSVNNHPLGTFELNSSNANGGSVDVRVPRAVLDDFNTLAFDVVQHYTNDCEDPFDAALWTRVKKSSWIDLPYRRLPVEGELLNWPYPLVDKLGYGSTGVTLVAASSPSRDTVSALGSVGFALGRLADYREVDAFEPVATAAEARTPALMLGTVAEIPEALTLAGVQSLAEDQGLVALVPNPSDNTLPVLIVTGGGATGLAKAAQALAGQDRYQVLSGSVSIVNQVAAANPPPTRQNPLPAPPASKFTFKDLGMSGATVRGYYPASVRVPIKLEGDARVTPSGGNVRIDYGYSAQLDSRLSTMEVRLGGLTIRSVPLEKTAGEALASVSVPLPAELLTPAANLDIVFHLFPRDFDECERVSDKQIWGTVHASSAFDISRDHIADLPDLSLLRHSIWPLTTMGPTGGTVVVLPDSPNPRATAAGFLAAARFGKLTHSAEPDFAMLRAVDASFGDKADKHYLLLVDPTTNSLYDSLAASGAVSLSGGPDRLLTDTKANLLAATVGTPYGTIEQTFSPANGERAVVVLRALREDGLAPLVEQMTDLGKVKELEGNAAVIGDDLSVRTVDVAPKRRWGSLPVATAATQEIKSNWFVLGALVIGGVFLLTAMVRVWAQARTNRD